MTSSEREPDWKPNPGPQTRFLSLRCFEALYGGSAGGGKSDALLADAIRYVGMGYGPAYQALLLRRAFPDLKKSLIGRSHALYPRLGGTYNEQDKAWTFPGGEKVFFGYLELEKDVFQYQGAAFPFIGLDETTQFSRRQYIYMISRCRSAHGIPCRMRGTTNPGGIGHAWVFERFGFWLDPFFHTKALPGQVLYFQKDERGNDIVVPKGTMDATGRLAALGRVFVPAKLSDNPYLHNDGAYERGLMELDAVEREQLLGGNWLITAARGELFKREWFAPRMVSVPRSGATWTRAWDLAASVATKDNPDPDWTAGVLLGTYPDGSYVIADVVRARALSGDVENLIRATAEADGVDVAIRMAQDPGQAGKAQAAAFAKLLAGYSFAFSTVTQNKRTAAGPLAAQCLNGNVSLVTAPWNAAFLTELEQFPSAQFHDDQVDAAALAFNRRAPALVKPTARPAVRTNDFDSSALG
jgi:predicted phage terminase large subunit-like protein